MFGTAQSKSVDHGFYAGMFWRVHTFAKANDTHQGHQHVIDHATVIIRGGVRVYVDEKLIGEFYAPAVLEIDREKFHRLIALEDNTCYACIFATKEIDETKNTSLWSKEERMNFYKKTLCADCTGCSKIEA